MDKVVLPKLWVLNANQELEEVTNETEILVALFKSHVLNFGRFLHFSENMKLLDLRRVTNTLVTFAGGDLAEEEVWSAFWALLKSKVASIEEMWVSSVHVGWSERLHKAWSASGKEKKWIHRLRVDKPTWDERTVDFYHDCVGEVAFGVSEVGKKEVQLERDLLFYRISNLSSLYWSLSSVLKGTHGDGAISNAFRGSNGISLLDLQKKTEKFKFSTMLSWNGFRLSGMAAKEVENEEALYFDMPLDPSRVKQLTFERLNASDISEPSFSTSTWEVHSRSDGWEIEEFWEPLELATSSSPLVDTTPTRILRGIRAHPPKPSEATRQDCHTPYGPPPLRLKFIWKEGTQPKGLHHNVWWQRFDTGKPFPHSSSWFFVLPSQGLDMEHMRTSTRALQQSQYHINDTSDFSLPEVVRLASFLETETSYKEAAPLPLILYPYWEQKLPGFDLKFFSNQHIVNKHLAFQAPNMNANHNDAISHASYWKSDQLKLALSKQDEFIDLSPTKLCIVDSGCLVTHSEFSAAKIKGIGYFHATEPHTAPPDHAPQTGSFENMGSLFSALNHGATTPRFLSLNSPKIKDPTPILLDSDTQGGHGTTVAGVIASSTFGLAKDVSLYIGHISRASDPKSYSKRFAKAIEWAIQQKVDIISLSIGDFGGFSFCPILAKQVQLAVAEGIVIVASGTNEGDTTIQPIFFPARLGGLICVGSHDYKGKPSSFSPVGKELDFLAPGEDIKVVDISHPDSSGSEFKRIVNGCSYATPAVAALCAYLCQYLDDLPKRSGDTESKRHTEVLKTMLRVIARSGNDPSPTKGYGPLLVAEFFQPLQVKDGTNLEVAISPAAVKLRTELHRLFPDWTELVPWQMGSKNNSNRY